METGRSLISLPCDCRLSRPLFWRLILNYVSQNSLNWCHLFQPVKNPGKISTVTLISDQPVKQLLIRQYIIQVFKLIFQRISKTNLFPSFISLNLSILCIPFTKINKKCFFYVSAHLDPTILECPLDIIKTRCF